MATQVAAVPETVYRAAITARRQRMTQLTQRVTMGKPCTCRVNGSLCGDRFYQVTYRGRKAVKAACYTHNHSAAIPQRKDARHFRDQQREQGVR